jgi:hypothetical protein
VETDRYVEDFFENHFAGAGGPAGMLKSLSLSLDLRERVLADAGTHTG